MKWSQATALLLLVAVVTASAASASGGDEASGSSWITWGEGLVQRVSQSVNQLRQQVDTARGAIEQQLRAFNATLRSNSELLDQLLPADTAHSVNKSLNQFFDIVNCVFQQPGCRLVPSTTGSQRSRRDLVIAKRFIKSSFSSAELQQARSFLKSSEGRVRRHVLSDTADITDRINEEMNAMLERFRSGVQQVRDNVETFRVRVNAHINEEADKTRLTLRCWFAQVCPTSTQRSARSISAENDLDAGAAVVRRAMKFEWFDTRVVGDFLTNLFNSNNAADVDMAVNRVRDALIEKSNQFACLLTMSCATPRSTTPA